MQTVEWDGIRALYRMVELLDRDAAREIVDAGVTVSTHLTMIARGFAPADTGRLRRSIRPLRRRGGASVRAGGPRVPYTRGIHFGWPTIRVTGRPFLFDAADRTVDVAAREYQQAVLAVWNRVVA